jgi:hypothetical protein
MHLKSCFQIIFFLAFSFLGLITCVNGQPITGVWKGKIHSTRIELKLIKKGDSLVGTSYYYESKTSYRRYLVRGYFENETNYVVWWDDQLIEDSRAENSNDRSGSEAQMAVADFNCPGDGVMKLEGTSSAKDDRNLHRSAFNLVKVATPVFLDEWDYVLENYTKGASDPDLIDRVAQHLSLPASKQSEEPLQDQNAPLARSAMVVIPHDVNEEPKKPLDLPSLPPVANIPLTTAQKFSSRVKKLQTVIPISGDSIELRFYDDAEIDGDSIAVYLNGRLVRQDIGLTDQPYKIMIPVGELDQDNELVMVAENLGSIPPNTSLMVVLMGDKRYEARLFADENSSALVRFVKESASK